MSSPYDILGVGKDASEVEIKKAYHNMMRKYHTDVHPGDENADTMARKINRAYQDIKKKRRINLDESKFAVGINDSDELGKLKAEYNEKISLFKYIDSSYYFMLIASTSSVDEILKLYGEAKKENARILLVEIRKKIILFDFLSKQKKDTYLENVVQIIRNSNGDYNEKVINDIEKIYLVAVKENAILGISSLNLLNADDVRQYLAAINNRDDADTVSNILSEALLNNYRQSVVHFIERLDFLRDREKKNYFLSVDRASTIDQLKEIGEKAVLHNNDNSNNRNLFSKMIRGFSSVVNSKEKTESRRRKI